MSRQDKFIWRVDQLLPMARIGAFEQKATANGPRGIFFWREGDRGHKIF